MKFRFIVSILTVYLLLISSAIFSQSLKDPAKALPGNVDNWKAGTDRFFNNETLYDYIDGSAELFLSFGFSKVYNRIYSDDKSNEIIVDIFYMNKPEDAYGAFLFTSGKVDSTFGSQSQLSPGAAIFWKSNYYISITSNRETAEGNKIILRLAEILDKSIPVKGEKPHIVKYLPANNLDTESVRYFRHYIWLNTHFFISNDDILNINQQTEAVTAKYGEGESKAVLILIEYPDESKAKTAFEKFTNDFYNGFISTETYKSIGRSSISSLNGQFIIAIFNCESGSQAKEILTSTIYKLPGNKN